MQQDADRSSQALDNLYYYVSLNASIYSYSRYYRRFNGYVLLCYGDVQGKGGVQYK